PRQDEIGRSAGLPAATLANPARGKWAKWAGGGREPDEQGRKCSCRRVGRNLPWARRTTACRFPGNKDCGPGPGVAARNRIVSIGRCRFQRSGPRAVAVGPYLSTNRRTLAPG